MALQTISIHDLTVRFIPRFVGLIYAEPPVSKSCLASQKTMPFRLVTHLTASKEVMKCNHSNHADITCVSIWSSVRFIFSM